MGKLRVAVIFGGRSGEHEVSLVSGLSVFKNLDKNKYDATLIGIDKTGRWLKPDESKLLAESQNPMLIKLSEQQKSVTVPPYKGGASMVLSENSSQTMNFDVVIPVLHGPYGEDGTIQGLLQMAQIPFVGSGVLGSSVCMDKDMTKKVLRDAGIQVVPSITLRKSTFEKNPSQQTKEVVEKLGLPLFVKPANLGSSVGVHKIKTPDEAQSLIEESFLYDTKVLVEKGINGRELECSILGNENPKASILAEIVPKGEFYSYDAKYIEEDGAQLLVPAPNLDEATVTKIQEMSKKAFMALECKGLARVDFFLDRDSGEVYLNEVNTMPGFTPISQYPRLWEASGVPYAQLLDELIKLALEDAATRDSLKTSR